MEFNDFTNATETFTTQKVAHIITNIVFCLLGSRFFCSDKFYKFHLKQCARNLSLTGHVEYSTSVYKQVEHVTVEDSYSYSFTYSFDKEKVIKS